MTIRSKHLEGLFDGTEEIELVPAPSSLVTLVISHISVHNIDTGALTPKIRRKDEAKEGDDDEYIHAFPEISLAADETIETGKSLILSAGQSIVGELDADPAANQPEWVVIWFEESYVPGIRG